MIVAYDRKRGEPRGRKGTTTGDCIDCKLCVNVCPTGIDIRKGLQLECIHCTQCVDACDSIMSKIDRAPGLIRYQTEAEVDGEKKKFFRPRLVIYTLVLVFVSSLLVGFVSTRADFKATLHRETASQTFTIDSDGKVLNAIRVHMTNRTEKELSIRFEPIAPGTLEVIAPEGVARLRPLEKLTVHLLIRLPREEFKADFGIKSVEFRAISEEGRENILEMKALGPAN